MTEPLKEGIPASHPLTWRNIMGRVLFRSCGEILPNAKAAAGSDEHSMALANATMEESALRGMLPDAGNRKMLADGVSIQRKEDHFLALSAYHGLRVTLSMEEMRAAEELPLKDTEIGRKKMEVMEKEAAEYWSLEACKREDENCRDLRERHRDAQIRLEVLRDAAAHVDWQRIKGMKWERGGGRKGTNYSETPNGSI